MDKVSVYIPFSKKNADQNTVEGFASTEAIDSQGETVKLKAVEKALPEYMKYGNIREMHQWSAVGKTVHAKIDKKKKGLFIKGKIIDGVAWAKVKEGVYNGFSIGGKVTKKIGNAIHELLLNEISLVDRPANPQAVFSLVKMENGKVVDNQMKKMLPIAPVGMESSSTDGMTGVKMADRLIAMASSVATLVIISREMERPSKHLDKALKALKSAAKFELETEKMAVEKKLMEGKEEQLAELKKIKSTLEKVVAEKGTDFKWDEKYFETLRTVL